MSDFQFNAAVLSCRMCVNKRKLRSDAMKWRMTAIAASILALLAWRSAPADRLTDCSRTPFVAGQYAAAACSSRQKPNEAAVNSRYATGAAEETRGLRSSSSLMQMHPLRFLIHYSLSFYFCCCDDERGLFETFRPTLLASMMCTWSGRW